MGVGGTIENLGTPSLGMPECLAFVAAADLALAVMRTRRRRTDVRCSLGHEVRPSRVERWRSTQATFGCQAET